MDKSVAVSGNSGPKIRSDCEIILELKPGGGISVDLSSRVKTLYGDSIIRLTKKVFEFFEIANANVKIIDSGALPFVIMARLEACIKQIIATDKNFLPEMLPENEYSTSCDRFRFSRLYLPGNSPGLMINAGLHSADGIILDLEDSVAPARKDEARFLVRNALRQVNFYGAERMVRINQGDKGIDDLHYLIPHNVNLILIPKCDSAAYVKKVEKEISSIRDAYGIKNRVFLMPVIENALGVEKAFEIAQSSEDVVAIALGLEDYTADLGVQRTVAGKESFYARTRMIVAAKAAGIQPIDSVFSDISDMDALKETVLESKSLGFEGMGCIHPRQISVIKQGFAPDKSDLEKSRKIVLAYEEAKRKGLGVVALGTKMIDPPVVARAQKSIDLAIRLGLLNDNWAEETSRDK